MSNPGKLPRTARSSDTFVAVCDSFLDWTQVLGSERLTGAALDRLTHRCYILETKGESYRLNDARRRRRSNDKESTSTA